MTSNMADENPKSNGDISSQKPTCTFFKKANRNRNVRKRKAEKSDSEDEDVTTVIRKEKKPLSNPMFQKTDGFDSKSRREREEIDDDLDVTFKSTRSAMRTGPEDLGATATVEIDTEFDRDAQALFEKSLKTNQELKGQEKDDKQYRGLNNYMTFYEKKGNAQGNAASGMVR